VKYRGFHSARDEGLHGLLAVCTGCKLCRPTGTYVHVGFGDGGGGRYGSEYAPQQ
jgi:hypothetical protein